MTKHSTPPPSDPHSGQLRAPALSNVESLRSQLMAQLERSLHYPVTLLIAPPGAGKTTLLAEWHSYIIKSSILASESDDKTKQIRYTICWLKLDSVDNDPAIFWRHFLQSLDSCQEGLYAPLAATLDDRAAADTIAIVTGLINMCAHQPNPILLVLDDYQHITAPTVHESLAFLLQHQPPQLHLLVATSVEPPLPIANLRARGKLLEVRANTLFSTLTEYHDQTHIQKAIQQALDGEDWQTAAHLMDETITAFPLKLGQSQELLALLQNIPSQVVYQFPSLCLFQAEGLYAAGNFKAAEPWFQATQQALAALEPTPRSKKIVRQIELYRAYTAAMYGDWQTSELLHHEIVPLLEDADLVEQSLVVATHIRANLARGMALTQVARLTELSLAYEEAGNLPLAIAALNFAAPLLLLQGRFRDAWRITHQVIQLGSTSDETPTALVGASYVYQADVLREWNRLDEAVERLVQGMVFAREGAYGMLLADAFMIAARLYRTLGEFAAAGQFLDQLAQHPLLIDNSYQQTCMLDGEQIRLWLAEGNTIRLVEWMDKLAQGSRHASPYAHERKDVGRALIALAEARPHDVLTLLEPLCANALTATRQQHAIEILLLQARAYAMLNATESAHAVLTDAVRLAEPEGAIRRFLDEGPSIEALLHQLRQQEQIAELYPFIDRILATYPQAE